MSDSVIDLTDIDEGNKKKRPKKSIVDDDEPPQKKKVVVVVDGGGVKAVVATTDTIPTSNIIHPIKATSNPLDQKGWGYGMVVYLAVSEKKDSKFSSAIAKCKSITENQLPNKKVSDCLQFDGTRHITMWQTKFRKQLTKTEAQNIRMVGINTDNNNNVQLLPLAIKFTGWKEKWTSGAYLELDSETTTKLKSIVENNIVGLPAAKGEIKCDHLSLYRNRGIPKQEFKMACSQIRTSVPGMEWTEEEDGASDNCGIYGTSIRLKIIGSDYSQCKVLAENIDDFGGSALGGGGRGGGQDVGGASLSAEDLRRKRLEALEKKTSS